MRSRAAEFPRSPRRPGSTSVAAAAGAARASRSGAVPPGVRVRVDDPGRERCHGRTTSRRSTVGSTRSPRGDPDGGSGVDSSMPTAPSLTRRHLVAERMDDPAVDPRALRRAFAALSRVHLLSGTGRRLRRALAGLAAAAPVGSRPLRMLDLACGGGDASLDAAAWARRRGVALDVVAVDRSPTALTVVQERARRRGLSITCIQADAVDGLPAGPFDLAFSSLFLHHLEADAVVRVLAACRGRARHLVMEDLARSRLGLLMAHVTLRLVSRSRVAWHDGPASVRAGWRRAELEELARCAGLAGARVRRCWPERWLLEAGPPDTP